MMRWWSVGLWVVVSSSCKPSAKAPPPPAPLARAPIASSAPASSAAAPVVAATAPDAGGPVLQLTEASLTDGTVAGLPAISADGETLALPTYGWDNIGDSYGVTFLAPGADVGQEVTIRHAEDLMTAKGTDHVEDPKAKDTLPKVNERLTRGGFRSLPFVALKPGDQTVTLGDLSVAVDLGRKELDVTVKRGDQVVGGVSDTVHESQLPKVLGAFAAPGFVYVAVKQGFDTGGMGWLVAPTTGGSRVHLDAGRPFRGLPAASADGKTIALASGNGVVFAAAGTTAGTPIVDLGAINKRLADEKFAPIAVAGVANLDGELDFVHFDLANGKLVATQSKTQLATVPAPPQLAAIAVLPGSPPRAYLEAGNAWTVVSLGAPPCPAARPDGAKPIEVVSLAGPFAKLEDDCKITSATPGSPTLSPAGPFKSARVVQTGGGTRLVVEDAQAQLFVSPPLDLLQDDVKVESIEARPPGLVVKLTSALTDHANFSKQTRTAESVLFAGVGPSGTPSATGSVPLGEETKVSHKDPEHGGWTDDPPTHKGPTLRLADDGAITIGDGAPVRLAFP